jgi:hypothetical protein
MLAAPSEALFRGTSTSRFGFEVMSLYCTRPETHPKPPDPCAETFVFVFVGQ